jgi:hypothetical protein
VHQLVLLINCLSSVYSVITSLHVSRASAAHNQQVKCIYVAIGTFYNSELTVSGLDWAASPTDSQLLVLRSTQNT